ncbi:MAG: CHC2 zinc finger domain-containing protein [Verrucomicrobiota bacterium]|jgi:DNA primase
MNTWIDFKELRSKLDFEQVLRHYGVEVKRKGNQHHGYCPLPNHNGKKNSPSFSANLERGIFQCFGCGAKGNVLEFAAMMEKADPKDGTALHKVAVELQQRFCPELGGKPSAEKAAPPKKAEPKEERPVMVNQPLDFELKGLDAEHPYLSGRGFTSETIRHFGLGFCSRGMLKDRVAIPLHDNEGKLVGYAGRVIDDALISEDNPRYRFPGKRERDGTLYEFRKTLFLYNGFRIKTPIDDLIVIEGFASVWWLHQNGLPSVVGTMGSDCSERQAELIVSLVKPNGRVWIAPDGDKAGERYAQTLMSLISPHRFVRWVKLDENKQPTDLSAEQLKIRFII